MASDGRMGRTIFIGVSAVILGEILVGSHIPQQFGCLRSRVEESSVCGSSTANIFSDELTCCWIFIMSTPNSLQCVVAQWVLTTNGRIPPQPRTSEAWNNLWLGKIWKNMEKSFDMGCQPGLHFPAGKMAGLLQVVQEIWLKKIHRVVPWHSILFPTN